MHLRNDGSLFDTLLGQIVGIEIPIARLQGKWKVSQNQPHENRKSVIEELLSAGDEQSQSIAALIERQVKADNALEKTQKAQKSHTR